MCQVQWRSDIANLWRDFRTAHYRWGEVTRTYWICRCFLDLKRLSKSVTVDGQETGHCHYPPSNYRESPSCQCARLFHELASIRTSGALIFALRSRCRLNVAPMCRHVPRTFIHAYVHAAASAADEFRI